MKFLSVWKVAVLIGCGKAAFDSFELILLSLVSRTLDGGNDDLRLYQVLFQYLVDLLKFVTAHRVVVDQVVVLLHHVGDLCCGEAISQNLGLRFHFLHQIRIFVHDFADLALQVRPNFLFVLDDVLRLVEFVLEVVNLLLKLLHLIAFLLLEVGEHLLEDQYLGLVIFSLLQKVINLLLHRLFPFLVCLQSSLHLQTVVILGWSSALVLSFLASDDGL